jgi:hypothetical protein
MKLLITKLKEKKMNSIIFNKWFELIEKNTGLKGSETIPFKLIENNDHDMGGCYTVASPLNTQNIKGDVWQTPP